MYGYHHLPLLIALQDLNLLVKSPSTAPLPFSQVRKALRLIVDDIDDAAPNDISYVYSGYAPLSIRLVQCITQKNAILSVGASTTSQPGESSQPERPGKKEVPRAHAISGWKGFEDVMSTLPGETVDMRQKADRQAAQGEYLNNAGLGFTRVTDLIQRQLHETVPPPSSSSSGAARIPKSRHFGGCPSRQRGDVS